MLWKCIGNIAKRISLPPSYYKSLRPTLRKTKSLMSLNRSKQLLKLMPLILRLSLVPLLLPLVLLNGLVLSSLSTMLFLSLSPVRLNLRKLKNPLLLLRNFGMLLLLNSMKSRRICQLRSMSLSVSRMKKHLSLNRRTLVSLNSVLLKLLLLDSLMKRSPGKKIQLPKRLMKNALLVILSSVLDSLLTWVFSWLITVKIARLSGLRCSSNTTLDLTSSVISPLSWESL